MSKVIGINVPKKDRQLIINYCKLANFDFWHTEEMSLISFLERYPDLGDPIRIYIYSSDFNRIEEINKLGANLVLVENILKK